MRLVDADAFKKILSEKEMQHDKRRSFDEYSYGAAGAYEYAGDLLDDMPTIELPQWTPCSKKLPEKVGDYLVTSVDERGDRHVTEAHFSVVRQEWSWPERILAWAYMPEPYDDI